MIYFGNLSTTDEKANKDSEGMDLDWNVQDKLLSFRKLLKSILSKRFTT